MAFSLLLLLAFFPLILGLSGPEYHRASGLTTQPYLWRWLAVTGVMFAASAVIYALAWRRAATRDRKQQAAAAAARARKQQTPPAAAQTRTQQAPPAAAQTRTQQTPPAAPDAPSPAAPRPPSTSGIQPARPTARIPPALAASHDHARFLALGEAEDPTVSSDLHDPGQLLRNSSTKCPGSWSVHYQPRCGTPCICVGHPLMRHSAYPVNGVLPAPQRRARIPCGCVQRVTGHDVFCAQPGDEDGCRAREPDDKRG